MMEVDTYELNSSANLPWVEKYRPSALADVLSHGDIIATRTLVLSNFLLFSAA